MNELRIALIKLDFWHIFSDKTEKCGDAKSIYGTVTFMSMQTVEYVRTLSEIKNENPNIDVL